MFEHYLDQHVPDRRRRLRLTVAAHLAALTTAEAMSPVTDGQMRFSLTAFVTVFGVLILINYWLLARTARRGPDAVALGDRPIEAPSPALTF